MPVSTPISGALRALCHATRIVAVAWVTWIFVVSVMFWGDASSVAAAYSEGTGRTLEPMSPASHTTAAAIVFFAWLSAAAVGYYLWKLFGQFIAGRIFARETVAVLVRLGWAGVAAAGIDLAVRPLLYNLVTGTYGFMVDPNGLLHVMMAFFIVVVAAVIKAGADIAEDHQQIV